MKKTKLQTVIGIAKELMSLFGVFVLLVGCDGGGGTVEVDGGGQGTGGAAGLMGAECKSGSECPVGNCQPDAVVGITAFCCDGCPGFSSSCSGLDYRNCETCLPFNFVVSNSSTSSYCGLRPDGVAWIPLQTAAWLPAKTAPTCPCSDATGTCRSKGDKTTISTTLMSKSGDPMNPYTYTVIKQTLTCDGTTWRASK